MKKIVVIIVLLIVGGAIATWSHIKEEKRVVVLQATFKMGGITYEGYEIQGDTLIFKFKRTGDVFTQAIVKKEVKVGIEDFPAKVVVEVNTNGNIKRYEAELIFDGDDERVYKASEL
ncbi:hypothetical protein VFC49_03200 [Thermococcus sp. SY098]|uniref:hypothetical protein n=1 Tax=Thermococcus sp. SY098 TaxID=3111325 RepID=UPI002D79F73B|nr:hypothetical protein [Thermococcus sp. SY098]WRS53149.1 hypothetical protein VFC49_03200 [Thermococcus sp. SY098]